MKVRAEICDEKQRGLISRVIATGVPAAAHRLPVGRNGLYRYHTPQGEVSIKAFKLPRFPNSYIYGHLRQGKAERSYRNSVRLAQLGFAVPAPYGYAEVYVGGALRQSYYFCQHLDGVFELRRWWERADGDAITRALAKEMVRLHRAGVWHKDFSPGNLLLREGDEGYTFYYVDVNRMEFDVRGGQLMDMFGRICLEPEILAQLATEYARAAGVDEAETRRVAQGQLDKYLNHKRKTRALKRLLRPKATK